MVTPEGVRSAGVIIDSVLAPGSELETASIAIECDLNVPVTLGRGSILHGATGLNRAVDVPDGMVIHQVPVSVPNDGAGTVSARVRSGGRSEGWRMAGPAHCGPSGAARHRRCGGVAGAARIWSGFSGTPNCFRCCPWRMRGRRRDGWWDCRASSRGSDGAPRADCRSPAARSSRTCSGWRNCMCGGCSRRGSGPPSRWCGAEPTFSRCWRMRPASRRSRKLGEPLRPRRSEAAAPIRPAAASQYYRASMFFAKAGLVDEAERSRVGRVRSCGRRPCRAASSNMATGRSLGEWRWDGSACGRSAANRFGRRMVRYAAVLPRLGRHGVEHRGGVERRLSDPRHDSPH